MSTHKATDRERQALAAIKWARKAIDQVESSMEPIARANASPLLENGLAAMVFAIDVLEHGVEAACAARDQRLAEWLRSLNQGMPAP